MGNASNQESFIDDAVALLDYLDLAPEVRERLRDNFGRGVFLTEDCTVFKEAVERFRETYPIERQPPARTKED